LHEKALHRVDGQKCFFLFLITSILFQQQASSQALPVAPAANFVMNRAVAGVLTRVAVARGFAANDQELQRHYWASVRR
jgi:hypothetical protein